MADFLTIYLNDHVAGADAAIRRARRLAESEKGAAADVLGQFVTRASRDRETLLAIMRTVGVTVQRYKRTGARLAELAGLLKMNGTVVRRSPLSTVLELEMLIAGVAGKRALWQSLEAAKIIEPDRAQSLLTDADDQSLRLTQLHAATAASVLIGSEQGP